MGKPAPVAYPTQKVQPWLSKYIWTPEEVEVLEKLYPDPCVTAEEIQTHLPWRTRNAIWLKAARLGLEIQWRVP